MTDRIKEQLSAFLDGELPEPESALLLKRLDRDLELRGALSRYSLIGAVLRSDGDTPAARQVAARVSAAIAREPLRRPVPARLARPLAGLGIAAAVAGLAVVLLQQWTVPPEPGPALAARALDTATALSVPVATVPEPAPSYTTPPAAEDAGRLPAAQFANYLVAHSGYASPLAQRSVVAGLIATGGTAADQAQQRSAEAPR